MPRPILPLEPLARFLLQSNHFSRAGGFVKPVAFSPPPTLKLSVYRIEGWPVDRVISQGKTVSDPMGKTLYGFAEIAVAKVRDTGLQVDPDDLPDEGHANVIGWPAEKDAQKSLSQQLSQGASLNLFP